jgi:hypothetical protein
LPRNNCAPEDRDGICFLHLKRISRDLNWLCFIVLEAAKRAVRLGKGGRSQRKSAKKSADKDLAGKIVHYRLHTAKIPAA